jgi:hypothetical protein
MTAQAIDVIDVMLEHQFGEAGERQRLAFEDSAP